MVLRVCHGPTGFLNTKRGKTGKRRREKCMNRTGHCDAIQVSLLNWMGTCFLPEFGFSILKAGLAIHELHTSLCAETSVGSSLFVLLSNSLRQSTGKHVQPSKYFIYILPAVSKCFQPSACHKFVHHLLLSSPYQSRACTKRKDFP